MVDQQLSFAEGFTMPTYDEWVGEVEKALKGAPFDKKMLNRTYEGITLRPIYTRNDWPPTGDPSGFPGAMPFTRGGRAAGSRVDNWDVRQAFAYPDPAAANETILHELERGVTSLLIQFDKAARAGLDGDADAADGLAGEGGVMLYSVDDLDLLLTGVYLDLISVALRPGAQFLPAAALLSALWQRRGVDAAKARGAFNADPLGTLAATGALPVPTETAMAQLADLARHTAATYPQVTAVAVDTSAYHNAGATESQDLAASMATAVGYLQAMTDAGLDIDSACSQIVFNYAIGCDQFLSICKLRAARKMWARIAEACGAGEAARGMRIHAITAERMMSRCDPWVNALRTTVACFAAAVGGADSITVLPYSAALGNTTRLARRVARNTHVILAEESNVAKVVDPGGGSWFIESLTDQLAEAAWSEFQAIESAGGMLAVLRDGSFAKKIADAYTAREANLAKRRDPLTGVSEFPNIIETNVEVEVPDLGAARADAGRRLASARSANASVDALGAASPGALSEAAVAAAGSGATIGAMAAALGGEGTTIAALPKHRFAEAFEALRDASNAYLEKTGRRPAIFLANLGPLAKHTARATFAKNFFEVAGIETLSNEGFSDAEACAKAFAESAAGIAVICSADPIYEQMVPTVAPALKKAGCKRLFLAGNPGAKKEDYKAAGVDDFIALGGNVLQQTRDTLALLGVI
ncbi:MAG: methylmalonyl-CoA mutase small subunit [Rhodospirillales bacterium]|nr:methylmalonyl-CoA mutase small subunit [Rhodospirillales bacterium]